MQSKNKNVRNELPPRYRRYCEFKQHLRKRSGGEVFPIGESNKGNNEKQLPRQKTSKSYGSGFNTENWRGCELPKIRRLTPTECERLQGFSASWTEGVSDTQRYKCLGNAVTVNVVREIIKRLLNSNK